MNSVELTPNLIQSYGLVLLATDHDDFDFDIIKQKSSFIIDTRGRYNPTEKIVC